MQGKIITILIITLLITTALPARSNNDEKVKLKANIIDDKIINEYIPGMFIVKFRDEEIVNSPSIRALNNEYQVISIEKVFKKAENTRLDNIYVFHVPKDENILSIIEDYSSNQDVLYAEPNCIVGVLPVVPDDERFFQQWALNNSGQFGGISDCDIDAPEAWDTEKGESDIIIASVDSGVDYGHEDIASNIWNNDDEIADNGIDDDGNGYIDDVIGWDFCNDDNDPNDELTNPQYGHGLRCAGLHSAVTNNVIGIAGVTWYCKTMVLRCYQDYYNLEYYANGIKYAADNGADVINIEMGISTYSELIEDSVNYAYEKGCYMVAAAGNLNLSVPIYPAAFENVTSVGATNQRDERCDESDWGIGHGSNHGDWVDVAAPGNYLWLLYPDDNYGLMAGGGTSLAAPHVAGLAGLILSKNPSLSPDEVKALICDEEYVDPYSSQYYIGTGRINAYNSLIATPQFNPPEAPDIEGPTSGKVGTAYTFTFNSVDLDGDDVYYYIKWGDGYSEVWDGPHESGVDFKIEHTYKKQGNFTIEARAKDIYDAESDISTFNVTITKKSKTINIPFQWLRNFLQFHPYLFPIIRQLLNI
ncbi:hypothetical protein AYK24_06840 [Thermoplasmatales archaeon SG8-52-4]|nr:MAG: hypothetical protein AYK24_06840 [Thermoplasmatales archaeon SG8-52-4]